MTDDTCKYEHFDMTGRKISLGDLIVVPIGINGSSYLKMGFVIKIDPKTLIIKTIKHTKVLYVGDKVQYIPSDPYLGEETHRTHNPSRCLLIDVNSLPEDYLDIKQYF